MKATHCFFFLKNKHIALKTSPPRPILPVIAATNPVPVFTYAPFPLPRHSNHTYAEQCKFQAFKYSVNKCFPEQKQIFVK